MLGLDLMKVSLPRMVMRRLAMGVVLLWCVSVLIFAGTQMLPGDAAEAILGQQATAETLASLRKELGLNKPATVRYENWLTGVMHGDFGRSFANQGDIATDVWQKFRATLFLASSAAVVSVPLALILGMLCVLYRHSWLDRAISTLTIVTVSLPEFFSGYLLMFFFGVRLQWFPTYALIFNGASLSSRLRAIALPCATLVLVVVGHMMRMTRATLLNVMSSGYIETAALKGIRPFRIIWRHALPNAVAPIINVVALNLAYLIVGVVVVEVIFVYPGMGQYMVDGVSKRDLPVVQACGLIFAAAFIGLNLIADIASVLANPRLRHPK
jgi:peptide/nickel transport system permease protein